MERAQSKVSPTSSPSSHLAPKRVNSPKTHGVHEVETCAHPTGPVPSATTSRKGKLVSLCTISTFCVSSRYLRRRRGVFARSFCRSTSGDAAGTLPAVPEVRLTTVGRVIATESRRNWLYFPGLGFRTKHASHSSRRNRTRTHRRCVCPLRFY